MDKPILIVEDDLTTQKILRTRLTQEGYQVYSATNGKEGLEQIRKRRPDLIIADVMMPIMNGFEFYKEIKNSKETVNIPVLIITSLEELQDSFLIIGADAFIAKPFQLDQLLHRTRQLLSGLKVQSINVSNEGNQVLDISPEVDPRMVLLTADLSDFTQYLKNEFSKRQYQCVIADTGQDVIEKAMQLHPRIILMNVQLKHTPAVEMINALNEFEGLKSQILIYSYFINEDLARDSDLNYFYTTYIGDISKNSKLPVTYLGVFSKNVSRDIMIKTVERYL